MKWSIGLTVCIAFSAPAVAQNPQVEATRFVHSLYRQYLDRLPDAAAAGMVASLLNGGSPADVKAGLLCSEEFYLKCQSNPIIWVNTLYAKVLNRPASPQEVAQWMERIRVNNGDRRLVALEFLSTPEANGAVAPPPPPANSAEAAERIVRTAQKLAMAVADEVPPSINYLARVQANNFLATCRAAQPYLANPAVDLEAANRALTNCERALIVFRDNFNPLPLPAPSSRRRLNDANILLAAMRASLGGPVPPPPPIGGGGFDNPTYEFYSRQFAELDRNSSQMVYLLRTVLGRGLTASQLLREAESFSANVDRVRDRLRTGTNPAQFQADIRALRGQADDISARFNAGAFDPRITQTWFATTTVLNQIADRAGLGGNAGGPVMPVPVVVARRKAIAMIDQCLAEVDSIAVANGAMVITYPALARFLNRMQSFRASLVRLREETANGAGPPALGARIRELNESLREAQNDYQRIGIANQQGSARQMQDLAVLLTRINTFFQTGQ